MVYIILYLNVCLVNLEHEGRNRFSISHGICRLIKSLVTNVTYRSYKLKQVMKIYQYLYKFKGSPGYVEN